VVNSNFKDASDLFVSQGIADDIEHSRNL